MSCSSDVELKWNQEEGYRWAKIAAGSGEPGFNRLSPSATGITFSNRLSDEHIAENQNLLNGSGVAAGDIDGDGLTDVYFAGLDGPNKLYKNTGAFEFKDITEKAGVAHEGFNSTGAVFADVDGDGDLDLLITSMSKNNSLYLNDGNGNFTLKEDSGLGQGKGSMTMALADIDSDGDLDLYVTNYKERQAKDIFDFNELVLENIVRKSGDTFEVRPPYRKHFVLFRDENGYAQREVGQKDELYTNNGEGSFHKVENLRQRFLDADGKAQGLEKDWGLTAKFIDFNGDLLPDLYVCNDFWTPDRLWINQGDGTFRAADWQAIRNFSFSSMAVDFSDINRDGHLDFFVTEMLSTEHETRMRQLVPFDPLYKRKMTDQPQYNRNTFYLNRGDTTFAEIAYFSGLEASGWSWATSFMDVDLDGYEDILVNTGFSHDVQDLDTQNRLSREIFYNKRPAEGYILEFPRLELANKAFRNNGDLTFSDKSNEWGFTEPDISQGMVLSDLDNDGDLDMAVNRLNQEAAIYQNMAGSSRIAVRLKGKQLNTQGIGAKIELLGGSVEQTKEITSGGDYLSGSEPLAVFAIEEANPLLKLRVIWPDGKESIIKEIKPNRIYEVEEPASGALASAKELQKASPPVFEDISSKIDYTHEENSFDDDTVQPLVPLKLSRLGPGVSWFDYDRDGDEDLFIAAAKGSRPGLFENMGNANFREVSQTWWGGPVSGDQSAIIGWTEENGTRIVAGSSNYEQESRTVPSAMLISLSSKGNSGKGEVPGTLATTGPLAAADYDGDNDMDFFIGGRFIPAHYPENADSRLFKSQGETHFPDTTNAKVLENMGMVTGAVFSDYDRDGDQDLLVSREWDSIALLQNDNGVFKDITKSVGLDRYKGWWNGIATGDFNNDGLPDIIATNWGLNSAYQLDNSFPLKMFYGDFDKDHRLEILESYYDKSSGAYVPRRGLKELVQPITSVGEFIQSFAQFAQASVEEVLGKNLQTIRSKEINTLQSMLFINTGDGFTARALPAEAQFAPAFGVLVADYDNDGNEDAFLSQNLFALPILFPRQDAGRGIWLRGDGTGELAAVPGNVSGVQVYGEQRGAAVADINLDGKVDLAIAQNGNPLKLYMNRTEQRGLLLRLIGPPSNRDAIGTAVRLIYENGEKGPLREIQAGSGYWSQNGFIQVMGLAAVPVSIEVLWFDGRKERVEVETGQKNISITY